MRTAGFATARRIALLLPLALIGGALAFQFVGNLVPCEMCMWQRWPHYAAIVVAALAFVTPNRVAQVMLVSLACLLIAASGAIGVFHAGVEYHWWNGITPCTAHLAAGSSGLDMIDQIQRGPLVRCDAPQWSLFNISLAGFNAIFSLAGAASIFVLAARNPRG